MTDATPDTERDAVAGEQAMMMARIQLHEEIREACHTSSWPARDEIAFFARMEPILKRIEDAAEARGRQQGAEECAVPAFHDDAKSWLEREIEMRTRADAAEDAVRELAGYEAALLERIRTICARAIAGSGPRTKEREVASAVLAQVATYTASPRIAAVLAMEGTDGE